MDKSLYVDDIDGARTFIKDKMLPTGRHVDPLQPTYQLPSFNMFHDNETKFLRNTLDVSDIDGATPKVPKKYAPRETMPNDIEGAQACWRPRHRRARLEAPPADIMDVSDVIASRKPLQVTTRRTNPIAPEYTIYGSTINDDPKYTKPKPLPEQIHNGHLLATADINTASRHWQPHMRREFRNLTSTQDIEGAQADTVIHSIVTKRETNPLQPTYQGLDKRTLLEPPVLPLMPPSIITRPTIKPSKDTGGPAPIPSSSRAHSAAPETAPEPVSYSARLDAEASVSARREDLEPAPFTDFVAPVQISSASPSNANLALDLSRAAAGSDLMATDPGARGAPHSGKGAAPPSGGARSGERKSSRAYDQYDPKPAPVSGGARSGRASGRSTGRASARERQAAAEREEEIRSVRDL